MLLLRRATAADVPALVVIARRAWLGAFAESAPPSLIAAWRARDREPAWYAKHWPTVTVALLFGKHVGLVQPAGDEINGLWVDPAHEGEGIGDALLRAAEREIAAAGHTHAWLTCSGFNPRALEFYRAKGYAERERGAEIVADGVIDRVYVLERALGAAAPAASGAPG